MKVIERTKQKRGRKWRAGSEALNVIGHHPIGWKVHERREMAEANRRQRLVLEFYAELRGQLPFLREAAEAHLSLVAALAPHLLLEVRPLLATQVVRSRGVMGDTPYDVPNHLPSSPQYQSLLMTREEIAWPGLAGPGKGCVSERALRAKRLAGADPADITVHEWLHTLEGLIICGRRMPSPDSNGGHPEFRAASGRAPDGGDTWHDWYRFLLRPT